MTNSETNTASSSSGFVSDALPGLHWLGFGHAGTLAAMRGPSPVCPSARLSVRVCASLSLSSARGLRMPSVRGPVCLPDGFPPTPKPPFVSQPPIHQDGPQHAAGRSAAWIRTSRSALTRRGCRKSERTPNHALQRTGVAVTARASAAAFPPALHGPRQPRPSLSLGSLGVSSRLVKSAPLLRLISGIIALSFAGCVIPIPHTSYRFLAMDGRVVDSRSRQPVAGALIALHAHPTTKTKSDANGCFHFPDYHNFHLGLAPGICAYSWPSGQHWNQILDISHPLYERVTVNPDHWTRTKPKSRELTRDDIPLVRLHQ